MLKSAPWRSTIHLIGYTNSLPTSEMGIEWSGGDLAGGLRPGLVDGDLGDWDWVWVSESGALSAPTDRSKHNRLHDWRTDWMSACHSQSLFEFEREWAL